MDAKTITWLGFEFHNYKYTAEDAKLNDFATYNAAMDLALNNYKLIIDWEAIDQSAYQTTINGLLASHTLPDSYCGSFFPTDTYDSVYKNGGFAAMDEVMEYAPETAPLYAEGGPLAFAKAWQMMEDGHWYTLRPGNNASTGIDLSNSTMKQRVPAGIARQYLLSIRQDWLNKLGLAMPSTTQEFRDALKMFQDEDVNGNGTPDECYVCHVGRNGVYSGVAQWFGLPYGNMVENPGTGKIEVAPIMPGYKPWLTYMHGLYEDTTILNNDGGSVWQYSVYCAGNYVSAFCVSSNAIWGAQTGDPDSDYEPMPLIQAVEGITPRFIAQEQVAGGVGFTFNSTCDLEAAGRMLDFLHSQEYYMLRAYGIEGVAYDLNDDGTITKYILEEDKDGYKAFGGLWVDFNAFPDCSIGNIWGLNGKVYDSIQDAIDADEPYTSDMRSEEEWKESVNYNGVGPSPARKTLEILAAFGEENLEPCCWYSFMTPMTSEEVEINAKYRTDLDTYLLELTTSCITGQFSVDEVDEKLQYAYDNLGLQECLDIAQARYNRFLVAMGMDPVE